MAVLMQEFVQEDLSGSAEWGAVHGVAAQLLAHLNEREAQQRLSVASMPGRSSALVQAAFAEFAQDLGFVDESKGLFDSYENRGLRPDYYLPVGDTGILLEVERGKTTINNMDLLDFWKCHLCLRANCSSSRGTTPTSVGCASSGTERAYASVGFSPNE